MSSLLNVVSSEKVAKKTPCILLAGQPNAGKTSLFNRLTGLRAHTANFPGTTVEVRKGHFKLGGEDVLLLDIPGLYGFEGQSLEQTVAQKALRGEIPKFPKPDVLVVVLDATRLPHQLPFAGELRQQGIPTVIALNMMDDAERKGIVIDVAELSSELGADVIPISAKKRQGLDKLLSKTEELLSNGTCSRHIPEALAACGHCTGCAITARCSWADSISQRVAVRESSKSFLLWSDRADRVLTNPWLGLPFFALVMCLLFTSVFELAAFPMDVIDSLFGLLSAFVKDVIPWELLSSFLAGGVITGVGAVLVFLPQIFILFFSISLLEDSGYLSRAIVAVDQIMRRFGLPGQAFVPMLSAHACAIPAIMSTRVIENRLDRLRTILVIPLLTCSARLPVYLMITVLLFGSNSFAGSMLFFSGYLLGGLAAIIVSLILQRTIVKGAPGLLAIELPSYRRPSMRVALYRALDRSWVFLRDAGKTILVISILLWAAITFPRLSIEDLSDYAQSVDRSRLAAIEAQLLVEQAGDKVAALNNERELIHSKYALEYSLAGRLGNLVEPIFRPLGFDWRISVGVLSSFAAREAVVSVLSIMAGVSEDNLENEEGLVGSLKNMKRTNGEPLFDLATALSLFVFFVLAMQCLPTQVITRRETGSWKWPIFQVVYMTVLAYGASLVTYQIVSRLV